MLRNTKIVVCLSAASFVAAAVAQLARTDNPSHASTSVAPVAYVYVSSTPRNSSTNEIVAYSAAADGKLTRIAGSPFREDVESMAVNGRYLFAANRATPYIDTYSIESGGALRYVRGTDYSKYNSDDCGSAGEIFLDRTGTSLYAMEYNGNICANNIFSSFSVEKATGGLRYLGYADEGAASFGAPYLAASFIGNNVFAYTAANSDCMYFETDGLRRMSDGLLVNLHDFKATQPAPPDGDRAYCPQLAAADRTNHVAITLQPANPPGGADGMPQLAAFTANGNGNLSTTNTSRDMPRAAISFANDLKMAPSGKLLAVGGVGGLQVFHFNGADPITHHTGLLTKETIDQMFWDNDNHLYAISRASGKLFVFIVTPTTYSEAPGSPYAIGSPQYLSIQPLPLPKE